MDQVIGTEEVSCAQDPSMTPKGDLGSYPNMTCRLYVALGTNIREQTGINRPSNNTSRSIHIPKKLSTSQINLILRSMGKTLTGVHPHTDL
jgi:hypothetical protein